MLKPTIDIGITFIARIKLTSPEVEVSEIITNFSRNSFAHLFSSSEIRPSISIYKFSSSSESIC